MENEKNIKEGDMKRNIVIVNNTLGDGGAEKILLDILEKFDFNNYNVKLLILNKKGVRINDINKNINVKYLYPNFEFKNKLGNLMWNWFKYRSLKHFYNIIYFLYVGLKHDVEIAFLEGDATRFVAKSKNKKSKKIAWVHTDLQKCRPEAVNDRDKDVYKNFDEIICVSKSSQESFKKLYKEINNKNTVIYNFINIKKIKLLAEEKIEDDFSENVIVAVGRLTKIKGFNNLIKAGNILKNRGLQVEIIILGIGEEYDSLQKAIEDLGLEKNIKLLGFKKNPYPYIKKSKICVMTSEFEGCPLVMAECMVMGKAIISTNHKAAKELLNNGENGVLVNINDEINLANEIENLILNKDRINHFEKKALKASYIFEYDKFEKKLKQVLNN